MDFLGVTVGSGFTTGIFTPCFFEATLATGFATAFLTVGLVTDLTAVLEATFSAEVLPGAIGSAFLATVFAVTAGFFALVAISTSYADFKENFKLEH